MPLVYACIAPHGGEIIAKLAASKKDAKLFDETRRGMLELKRQMEKASPDTIVISNPHNLRLWKNIGIVFSEHSSGSLKSESKRATVSLSANCNVKLAREIYSNAANSGLPVVGANYGTFEGEASDLPMDWGTMIPLYFLLGKKRRDTRKIVIVTPSREIPLEQNFLFGKEIGKLAQRKSEKIAFVASADQAHTHKKSGIYGYHPSAKEFDRIAVECVRKNDFDPLLKLDPRFIEDSKPDSPWQIAMLAGVLSQAHFRSRMISYQVPTYYGMICADYAPPQMKEGSVKNKA